jgi:23S rRNA pseudouridine1911/1915/1917 synthase
MPVIKKNYSAAEGPDLLELSVPVDAAGLRLDQVLARLLPEHSRNRLAQWVREERVTVDGCAASPRSKVWGGERLQVRPSTDPEVLAYTPEAIPLQIVHEDETLLVVDKPAGLVVHPGSGNWQGTLLNALLQHAPALAEIPRAGIVHRLDKETSGLLVVAKTLVAQTDLVRQLQARTVTREYAAIAHGRIARDGIVTAPIGRHPVHRTRMAVVASGKPAVTHYHVVEQYARATRLRCRLETGRTHQIRVHLASIGHPLLGDPVYGTRAGKAAAEFHRQALHAQKLALIHPATRQLVGWESALPADMRDLIETLSGTADTTSLKEGKR